MLDGNFLLPLPSIALQCLGQAPLNSKPGFPPKRAETGAWGQGTWFDMYPGRAAIHLPDMTVYFQFPRSPELSRYFRALALRQAHRQQRETPNAGMWGADGRRVSRGRFRVVGCGAFRQDFDGGLGSEAEETALFLPILRQVFAQSQQPGRRQLDWLMDREERTHDARSEIRQSNKRG
jgi:hypothetical protein